MVPGIVIQFRINFFPLFCRVTLRSERMLCFVLNNLHFSMVEGIAFYKSRVLIMPFEADDFCLFIRLPDEIFIQFRI